MHILKEVNTVKYEAPEILFLMICDEDLLSTSGELDDPNVDNNGWL